MNPLAGLSEQETRELLTVAFEYSFLHDDWVCPWEEALHGVSAEQAAWRPGEAEMGIWDIVLHVAVWNENIVERVETGGKARPAEGAWPLRPADLTEENWQSAKDRLSRSIESLRSLIESTPLDKVRSSPYGFGDLVCRFIHMAYHCGQIVKIRECRGW